jgi:small subunit ribosomal protein S17
MTSEGSMSSANTSPEAAVRHTVKRIGTVKSDKMDKSIVVRVDRKVLHPVYKKYVKRHTTLVAHDENNEARTGDRVEVVFSRPLSRSKRWRLVRVITAAHVTPSAAAARAGAAPSATPSGASPSSPSPSIRGEA